jgi:hypothetical protein
MLSVELTDRREWGGGWERSQTIQPRESMVLHKSFNILWVNDLTKPCYLYCSMKGESLPICIPPPINGNAETLSILKYYRFVYIISNSIRLLQFCHSFRRFPPISFPCLLISLLLCFYTQYIQIKH